MGGNALAYPQNTNARRDLISTGADLDIEVTLRHSRPAVKKNVSSCRGNRVKKSAWMLIPSNSIIHHEAH
jgi:hypothetical protein